VKRSRRKAGPANAFCFAENDERSPWEPLRVGARLFHRREYVTVVAVRGFIPVSKGPR